MIIPEQELKKLCDLYKTKKSLLNNRDLSARCNSCSNANREQFMEDAMEKVLPGLAHCVSDWEQLLKMWHSVCSGSRTERRIKGRMIELIKGVLVSSCPDWFVGLIKNPDKCPVIDCLDSKVEEFRRQLEK